MCVASLRCQYHSSPSDVKIPWPNTGPKFCTAHTKFCTQLAFGCCVQPMACKHTHWMSYHGRRAGPICCRCAFKQNNTTGVAAPVAVNKPSHHVLIITHCLSSPPPPPGAHPCRSRRYGVTHQGRTPVEAAGTVSPPRAPPL
jgi:hypothetical protein